MLVSAELEFALAALSAFVAVAAEAPDADTLSFAPDGGHLGSKGDDPTDYLMSGDARPRSFAPFDIVRIGAAKAACLHGDEDFPSCGNGHLPFYQLELSGSRDDHGPIGAPHNYLPTRGGVGLRTIRPTA